MTEQDQSKSKRRRVEDPLLAEAQNQDGDDEQQVRIEPPRSRGGLTRNPTPSPILRTPAGGAQFGNVGLYPNLLDQLEKGLSTFEEFLQKRLSAQQSLAKAQAKSTSRQPPKSLIPNVEVHLPSGFELDEKLLQEKKMMFALDVLDALIVKRQQQVDALSNTADHSQRILEETLRVFQEDAPQANKRILELVSLPTIKSWWDHYTLLVQSRHEAKQVAAQRRSVQFAAQAEESAMELDTAPPEQLVGDAVSHQLQVTLAPLLTQLKSLREEVQQIKQRGAPSKPSPGPSRSPSGNAGTRGQQRGGGSATGKSNNFSASNKGRVIGQSQKETRKQKTGKSRNQTPTSRRRFPLPEGGKQ